MTKENYVFPWRDGLPPVRAFAFLLPLTLFLLTFTLSPSRGCGLDWTLPQAHFEGVDEQGYVSYWEKIGQADLGDGLIIPVHINFNSHREASSPTLGKGWMLPLLESHVEPVDENTLHVIMPDGWTFLFLRNGNTETWRGNAGWAGETDGARFTITAPCGWRVKFDSGKIQEIDTPKNRTIAIKYNGPAPVEADIDNTPFVQVEQNTATGVAQAITIGGQKIAISQAQRPRIQTVLGKTLITGFDPALSALQWPDGKKETFDFSTPQSLTPTLVITRPGQSPRNFTWDAATSRIKTDGQWAYCLNSIKEVSSITRTNSKGQSEAYGSEQNGAQFEKDINGIKIETYFFRSGLLNGQLREIVNTSSDGKSEITYQASYDEKGNVIRELRSDQNGLTLTKFQYDSLGINLIKTTTIRNGNIESQTMYENGTPSEIDFPAIRLYFAGDHVLILKSTAGLH
jgi:hypothetical protein